jgi:hypothetical protein
MRLVVILIKPSKYDNDGYLVQFRKQLLPCNSLAVLCGLTEAAFQTPFFKGMDCQLVALDETTRSGRVSAERLMGEWSGPDTRIVVGFVAVQTNMFPRARDLAHQFRSRGATVIMGGSHVSGSITMLHDGNDPTIPCPARVA